MAFATSEEQRQIIHDCFNGNQERDCDQCPAHSSRVNGKCCFGNPDEYDDESEDCQQCPHEDDCSGTVAEQLAEEEEAEIERQATLQNRFRYRNARPVARPTKQVPKRENLVQIGALRDRAERRRSLITRQAENKIQRRDTDREEPQLERFVKDSVWGAGQGFFEMAAEFFRTHRWR